MQKKIAKLFFVCDVCGAKEEPRFALQNKLEKGEASVDEFPYHCAQTMRLTIMEVEVEKKVAGVDIDAVKNAVVSILKMYLMKTANDVELRFDTNDVELQFATNYFEMIEEKTIDLKENNMAMAEIVRLMIKPALESIEELHDHYSTLVPLLRQQVDIAIQSAKNRLQDSKPKATGDTFMPMCEDVEELEINSVGIDCGSSTTHLIFSKIRLKREAGFLNLSRRYNVIERTVLYKSEIINTPLIDAQTIDIPAVVKFIKSEYHNAGYELNDIDTGAVIVTGETAKKQNAADIVNLISDEAGKFVSATAGPNFESMLAALGSGATQRSNQKQNTILSVDIGGGTSNLALSVNGKVMSTSCINVGGRLLGIDESNKIWRIDEPTRVVMKSLGLQYEVGDTITSEHIQQIAKEYSDALIEVMQGPAISEIAQYLMMTRDLDFSGPIDEIIFSGGVAEFIYGNSEWYNDIGQFIASNLQAHDFGITIVEPKNKIRATVIGAGSYSLAVSGSTCYYDKEISLPLRNIPVLSISGDVVEDASALKNSIQAAYKRYDYEEGSNVIALYFAEFPYFIADPTGEELDISMLELRDMGFKKFARSIEAALPRSIENNLPILLLFKSDIAGMIGRFFPDETAITQNFMFIDELVLSDGDYIDIGQPLAQNHTFPITVKSLVFN